MKCLAGSCLGEEVGDNFGDYKGDGKKELSNWDRWSCRCRDEDVECRCKDRLRVALILSKDCMEV